MGLGPLFDAIAHPLANVMLLFYSLLGNQTVLAIAAITILINLILLPLTLGQQRSARRMQEIQPELEKLKKKYGSNREQFAQEQAKLFKERGINPVGGCLPLLVQMPIWFGLYRAIVMLVPTAPLDVFEFSKHIYNWLPGVQGLVPLQSTWLGMDLGRPPGMPQWWSYLLPVLVFGTSWLQQKLISPPSAAPTDSSQPSAASMTQQMQIMMPLMFGVFSLQFAVGLSIYFIISNLIRIAQYYVFPSHGQRPALFGRKAEEPVRGSAARKRGR
jgi:YidC/Oxa1 family membrane protein insertase